MMNGGLVMNGDVVVDRDVVVSDLMVNNWGLMMAFNRMVASCLVMHWCVMLWHLVMDGSSVVNHGLMSSCMVLGRVVLRDGIGHVSGCLVVHSCRLVLSVVRVRQVAGRGVGVVRRTDVRVLTVLTMVIDDRLGMLTDVRVLGVVGSRSLVNRFVVNSLSCLVLDNWDRHVTVGRLMSSWVGHMNNR